MSVIEVKTVVQPDGGIKIEKTDLPVGQEVTVRISLETSQPKRKISEILANYPGGRGFKSVEEVEQYLRQERDSWGD